MVDENAPPGSGVDFGASRPRVLEDVYPVALGSNGEWKKKYSKVR